MAAKRKSRQAGNLTAHEQESALGGAASSISQSTLNAAAEQSPPRRRRQHPTWTPLEMAAFAAELGGELGEVRP